MNKKIILITVVVAATVMFLISIFFPVSLQRQTEGVCLIECRSSYIVALPEGDTLRLSFQPNDTLPGGMELRSDSTVNLRQTSAIFISNCGDIICSAALHHFAPDTLRARQLLPLLQHEANRVDSLRRYAEKQMDEIRYYHETHTVEDEGYTSVMEWATVIAHRLTRLDSLSRLLHRALEKKDAKAGLSTAFCIIHQQPGDTSTMLRTVMTARSIAQKDSLLLLQTDSATLPHGAFRFTPYLFPTEWFTAKRWQKRIIGYPGNEQTPIHPDAKCAEIYPDSLAELLPLSEGSAAVNVFGQLCGVVVDGQIKPFPTVRSLVYGEKNYFQRLFNNLWEGCCRLFRCDAAPIPDTLRLSLPLNQNIAGYFKTAERFRRLRLPHGVYIGTTQGEQPDGYGIMQYADGNNFLGAWQKGRRSGTGVLTDTLGITFSGTWTADTLPSGIRRDSLGVFLGDFNAEMQRSNDGLYLGNNGEVYQGAWYEDQRHGFGLSVSDAHIVRCGTWKRDNFRGERMIYTAERIYGIDISRYQHEIGRGFFSINWSDLRITSLGRIGNKHTKGKTDYPVSFIYIKATQGTTILNRYYADDIKQARQHKIPVGAYHFFSTQRRGKEQAKYFLENSDLQPGDLPPVLDIEPYDHQIKAMGGAEVMFREVSDWVRMVEKACGTKPVLYVSQSFINEYMEKAPAALKEYPVWVARYGEFKPYVRLLQWQLSCDGKVNGITGSVDINVFNGTAEHFQDYLKTSTLKESTFNNQSYKGKSHDE